MLLVIPMVLVEHGSYIFPVLMHATGSLGTDVGQVKVRIIKCKCVCNYARAFRSKEQNSSKGIYVMHRRRLAKPPCLHEPKAASQRRHSRQVERAYAHASLSSTRKPHRALGIAKTNKNRKPNRTVSVPLTRPLLLRELTRNSQVPDALPNPVKLLDSVSLSLTAHVPSFADTFVLSNFTCIRAKATTGDRISRRFQPSHALLHPRHSLLVTSLEVLQHSAVERVESLKIDSEILRILVPVLLAHTCGPFWRDRHHRRRQGLWLEWVGRQGVSSL